MKDDLTLKTDAFRLGIFEKFSTHQLKYSIFKSYIHICFTYSHNVSDVRTLDAVSGNTTYEFLTRIIASTDRVESTRTFISLDF